MHVIGTASANPENDKRTANSDQNEYQNTQAEH
jgi:hypothetical protein